jgi:ribosomal protein S18 acetylase RimI-like enzyme
MRNIPRSPLSGKTTTGSTPLGISRHVVRLVLVVVFMGLLQIIPNSHSWTPVATTYFSCRTGESRSYDHLTVFNGRSTALFETSSSSLSSSSLSSNNNNDDNNGDYHTNTKFQIRLATYADLGPVTEIILDSFYVGKTTFRGLLRLAELNRLQQNFPHFQKEQHQMYVAVVNNVTANNINATPPTTTTSGARETIVGFVDIDMRPCKPEIKLPRPYLSDLCVHPNYRRQGIAQGLVMHCQDFVIQRNNNNSNEEDGKRLYIRVEEDNTAAVRMYHKLGYKTQGVETTRERKNILTLVKVF